MNKSKIALSVGFLAIMALAGGLFASLGANDISAVSASDGDGTGVKTMRMERLNTAGLSEEERQAKFQEMDERRTAIKDAFEKGDYNAWREVAGDTCPMISQVTKENFKEFAESRANMQGKGCMMAEGGEKGLGCGGKGKGMGRGMHGGMWKN